MKELLQLIVGRNVLNGESSASDVVKLAKIIKYYETQFRMMKSKIDDLEFKDWIDSVLKSGNEILNEAKTHSAKEGE